MDRFSEQSKHYAQDDGYFAFDSGLSSPSVSSTVTSNFSFVDTTSSRSTYQASPACGFQANNAAAAPSFQPVPVDEWSATTASAPSPLGRHNYAPQQHFLPDNTRLKQHKDLEPQQFSPALRGHFPLAEENLRRLQAMQNLGAGLEINQRVLNSLYGTQVSTQSPRPMDGSYVRQFASTTSPSVQRPVFLGNHAGYAPNLVLPPLQAQAQAAGQALHSHSEQQLYVQPRLQTSARNPVPLAVYSKCTQIVTSYIQDQSRRPNDNSVHFWRNLFQTYFAEGGTQRWCLACYNNSPEGRHAQSLFPMDFWKCHLCGVQPGRGFEANVDALPRLSKIKYDSGLMEEFFFLDIPEERYMLPSGNIIFDYSRVVHESKYAEMRIIRYGKLRVVFNSFFKLASWEFCTKSHEEAVPRKIFLHQVQQLSDLIQEAEKEGADVSLDSLKARCNAFTTAAKQLAVKIDAPSVNDLGFSKRYVRCLQVSEVVSSMDDLIAFSKQTGLSPINSLARYPGTRKRPLESSSPQSSSVTYAPQMQAQQPTVSVQKIQEQPQLPQMRGSLSQSTLSQLKHHLIQQQALPRHLAQSQSNQSIPVSSPQSDMSDLRSSVS